MIGPHNIHAVRELQNNGIKVSIVSSCGDRRADQVRRIIMQNFRDGSMPEVYTCYDKVGQAGKSALCKSLGMSAIFDDRLDILRDCSQHGIETYHIRPPKWNWCPDTSFQTLWSAVQQYLVRHTKTNSYQKTALSDDVWQHDSRPKDAATQCGRWLEVAAPLPKYVRNDLDGSYLWWDQKSCTRHWQWQNYT